MSKKPILPYDRTCPNCGHAWRANLHPDARTCTCPNCFTNAPGPGAPPPAPKPAAATKAKPKRTKA